MRLRDLSENELAQRLKGPGILFRVGPFVARLQATFPELYGPIGLLYGDFPLVEPGGIVDFTVRIAPPSFLRGRLGRQAMCFVDGEPKFKPFPRRFVLPHLEWCFNWCVFTRPNQYLILHSAVVERGGRALIISGKPGAGKSTLCAGLMFRGWRLLSDEVALIRPGIGNVTPVPRPVGLKDESIDVIRRFEPAAVLGPSCPGTRKGTVAHLRPPADSVERGEEPALPAWMFFLSFEPGASAELTAVSKAETLVRVAENAFNYSVLGADGFETLADVIESSDCYELRYRDLDEAIQLIDDLPARLSGPLPRADGVVARRP